MTLQVRLLLSALVLTASLSPILTFSRLWQIKEWRIDRLREHCRENGLLRQLFGVSRPLATAILILMSGVPLLHGNGAIACLSVLGALSLLQIILHPRTPVWTSKAKAIVVLSAVLMAACAFVAAPNIIILISLPLLSPIFVGIAWMTLHPVDTCLKKRVLRRAISARVAHPNLRVIGITGSVGKTTLKEMLSHILKDKGAITTPERVNTEMGVAAWLTKELKNEPTNSDRIVIVEMGAYRKNEISLLCSIAKPMYGAITYVGDQHLSLFGNREAIVEGKGELFAALPKNGHAFGNSDNDAFPRLKSRCPCPITAVGTDHHADLVATDIEETGAGIRFKAEGTLFTVPVSGTHHVTGVLLAIAVAKKLGVPMQEIAQKLRSFKRMSRTFEVKKIGNITVLDDTYNSSPDSVRAAIRWAGKQPHATKILVLEGIIELGDAEAKIHTELAEIAAPIFTEAYAAHPRHLAYLRQGGFGNRALMASHREEKAPDGSLVVFVGRLAPSIMARFV